MIHEENEGKGLPDHAPQRDGVVRSLRGQKGNNG